MNRNIDPYQHSDITENRPWLSWISDSQSTNELEKRYDAWANTYDFDVDQDWSQMPVNIAQTLSELVENRNVSILDAGAGSGLVGQAMAGQGYTHLTAIDLSEKMLSVAQQRQVYSALYQKNLEDSPIFKDSIQFDVITAAGVFAFAHAGVEVLKNLFDLLKEDGFFLLTIREDYREQMQNALDHLAWTLVSEEKFPIYNEAASMYILAFQKK